MSGVEVGSAFLRSNHLGRLAPGMPLEGPGPARNSGGVALLWSPRSREVLTSRGPAGVGRAEGHSSLERTQAAPLGKWSSPSSLVLIQAFGVCVLGVVLPWSSSLRGHGIAFREK